MPNLGGNCIYFSRLFQANDIYRTGKLQVAKKFKTNQTLDSFGYNHIVGLLLHGHVVRRIVYWDDITHASRQYNMTRGIPRDK